MAMKIINKTTINSISQQETDNLIFIDKAKTWSSFDVVKKVRTIGKFKKVGHAGTLDPFATGLLILATNKETSRLSKLSIENKSYLAKIKFGQETDTHDLTGRVIRDNEITSVQKSRIEKTIESFLGESEQIPPMFSAKKKDGVRLYKLAREGKNIIRDPHKITIYDIQILGQNALELEIFVKCSKGTYIRRLAHDIGQKTNYGAYLLELRRLEINGYNVNQALTINEFEDFWISLN
jgi:tRNA pseudouridine55 synthase